MELSAFRLDRLLDREADMTAVPALPGLTEIVPAPESEEEWRQQNGVTTPIASMTTIHLMHCTVWMERNAEKLRRLDEDRMLAFMLRNAGQMSDATDWFFDTELDRVANLSTPEWLDQWEPYVDMSEELDYRFGLARVPKAKVRITDEECDELMRLSGPKMNYLQMKWVVSGPLVINLQENEWAIRPLAVMRGLAA